MSASEDRWTTEELICPDLNYVVLKFGSEQIVLDRVRASMLMEAHNDAVDQLHDEMMDMDEMRDL